VELKTSLTLIGVAITIVVGVAYIRDVYRGKTKPHLVTWLIWSVLAGTGCIIQIIGGGGLGSMVLGVTALMNLVILGTAWRRSRHDITRFDKLVLGLAAIAVAAWLVTNNPRFSAILVTLTMLIGFIPTYKKSFRAPVQESISLFLWSGIKQFIGIAALSAYNLLTLLFPLALIFGNFSLVALLAIRRRQLKTSGK